jgi:hypothetical protein
VKCANPTCRFPIVLAAFARVPQLEVLVSGVQWPADVDPTAREQRLPDAQFEQLFGMPKPAFNALPLFKRTRLKKDKALF